MIDTVDTDMLTWLTDVVAPLPVSLSAPSADPAAPGVACHLLSLCPDPPPRGNRRPPVQARARYLITATCPEPLDAHRALGQVLVAATDRADIDIELDEQPPDLWRAFGVVPQAAVVLRAIVRWERPHTVAPLVREPLLVQFERTADLVGVVVSPDGLPIARAAVRAADVDTPAWTAADGRFTMRVPARATGCTLTVTARGISREVTVDVSQPADHDHPVAVVFNPPDHGRLAAVEGTTSKE
jgi:hypothetical protein